MFWHIFSWRMSLILGISWISGSRVVGATLCASFSYLAVGAKWHIVRPTAKPTREQAVNEAGREREDRGDRAPSGGRRRPMRARPRIGCPDLVFYVDDSLLTSHFHQFPHKKTTRQWPYRTAAKRELENIYHSSLFLASLFACRHWQNIPRKWISPEPRSHIYHPLTRVVASPQVKMVFRVDIIIEYFA